jgi:hypothetical protein
MTDQVRYQRVPRLEPGQRFGRWTVIKEVAPRIFPSGQYRRTSHVICSCGNERRINVYSLVRGDSKRCVKCAQKRYRFVDVHGTQFRLKDLLREHGITRACYDQRRHRGMDVATAATKPVQILRKRATE